jgi:tetratricopeptide (TPR) repeat protein
MARHAVAQLDEIEELVDDRCLYRPVRLQLGITAFGATVWSARAAGDLIVNEHDPGDPTADQELFVVLRGHARFELEGEGVDAPTGTFVFAPPGMKRRAVAEEAGTEVLLIEGTPGKGYEPRGWELWAPLAPLYAAGHYAEVADRLRVAIEEHSEYALLFFNLACCESLTGRTADALQHLGQAIELAEEFREHAKHDADLQAIREEPGFRKLISD